MAHTDDAYATMLLTMALSPNKEEYARPFTVAEFYRFEAAARASNYRGIGALLDVDISGLMIYLGLSEEESFRAYTLLHRGVQLSYAMDGFAQEGIEVVTRYDGEYPNRLSRKLGQSAPPCFYLCGDPALLNQPAVAVVGISGVRTTEEVRSAVDALVRGAIERGYAIITGGEPGVARMAAAIALEQGGKLLEILGPSRLRACASHSHLHIAVSICQFTDKKDGRHRKKHETQKKRHNYDQRDYRLLDRSLFFHRVFLMINRFLSSGYP